MRKRKSIMFFAALFLFLGILPAQMSAASNCSGVKPGQKVWWDGVELKAGQIGRLFVQKDTALYKLDGEKKTIIRTLKVNSAYRIYAFKPGKLSVGGGLFVDRDTKVTYETPSKAKLALVACANPPMKKPAEPASADLVSLSQEGAAVYFYNARTKVKEKLAIGSMYTETGIQAGDWMYLIMTKNDRAGLYRVNIKTKAEEILFNETAVNFAAGDGKLYVLSEDYDINDDHIWVSDRYYSITEMTFEGKDTKLLNKFPVYGGALYPESFTYYDQYFYIVTSSLNDNISRDISISKYSKDDSYEGVVYEVQDQNSESFITYTKGSVIVMESVTGEGKIKREFKPGK
ncbi:hypothetical protein [Cytobacillus sp. SAFR-174]|uniref:hypothetical protein n=1 Tax=Cytobacillus sp. SAFR-174 TaxID=3436868 RepID=UPI003F7D0AA4